MVVGRSTAGSREGSEVVEEGGNNAQQLGFPGGLTFGAGAAAGEQYSCRQRAQAREAGVVASALGGAGN